MQVRSQQNDTVDQLCWRHLGRTAAVVEALLDIKPGLAALGPVLPAGDRRVVLRADSSQWRV